MGRMESTPRRHGTLALGRSGRRRRPTGDPPPAAQHQATGVWWALAAVVLVTLAKVAFARPGAASVWR